MAWWYLWWPPDSNFICCIEHLTICHSNSSCFSFLLVFAFLLFFFPLILATSLLPQSEFTFFYSVKELKGLYLTHISILLLFADLTLLKSNILISIPHHFKTLVPLRPLGRLHYDAKTFTTKKSVTLFLMDIVLYRRWIHQRLYRRN